MGSISKTNWKHGSYFYTNIRICISCSLVFLAQTVGDFSVMNQTMSVSSYQNQSLCLRNVIEGHPDRKNFLELTWSEFVTELGMDMFVATERVFTSGSSQVLKISSDNGFYFLSVICNRTISSKSQRCGSRIRKFIQNCSEVSEDVEHRNKLQFVGNRELRVAGVFSEEYAYDTDIQKEPDGSYRFRDSFSVELLNCLELTLNFTSVPVVTFSWGHQLENKSWTGMIALLLSNQADIGLSSIADRPFRRAVIDFNIPTNVIRLAAFFQKPSSISSETIALLKPFQPQFWLALLVLGCGMTVTTFVINKTLFQIQSEESMRSSSDYKALFWDKLDCVQWSVSTFCLQGFYKVPKQVPSRIGMIVGSLSGFVIYSAYSGTLISFLSVLLEPIQNLGQLLSTDFTFVIVNDPLPLKFFADSPDPRNVMVYKRHNTEMSYSSMKEAYQKVVQGSFAFLTDHSGAYESLTDDFSVQEACLVREIPIDNAEQKQGTLLRKHSPYKRPIDYQILRMIEFGLVRRWNWKYLKRKPICDRKSNYEGVTIESLLIAFYILGVGIAFGAWGLLFEIRRFRCGRIRIFRFVTV